VSTQASVLPNAATLRVTDDQLLGPVLSRVVGMLAARANCPIDRLDDALLLTDALAAHAPGFAAEDAPVVVSVRTDDAGLELAVDGLPDDAPERLLAAADLPEVGNVLRKVADDVRTDGGALRIRLRFGAGAR
jgi:serine/threonine-protein kinase RsbW